MEKRNLFGFLDNVTLPTLILLPFLIPLWVLGEVFGLFLPPLS